MSGVAISRNRLIAQRRIGEAVPCSIGMEEQFGIGVVAGIDVIKSDIVQKRTGRCVRCRKVGFVLDIAFSIESRDASAAGYVRLPGWRLHLVAGLLPRSVHHVLHGH